ncbi:uncharacterized protein V6R79_005233 [Siganus canaliculatus]
MSGDFPAGDSFVAADFVLFALVLAVSTAVGFYYAWVGRAKQNSSDFLTAGRRLTALPVSMSLTAGFMSSTTLLSNPTDVYLFGAMFVHFGLAYVLSILIVSEAYLPVFYRLGITSTYEYLELRFSRATRLMGTLLYMLQTIFFTGIIIYGPALTLNQFTGVDKWVGIISTGLVCTIYCTLGGLKAVVWTDVFQIGIMFIGYVSVIVKSVISQGGIHTIISDARQGGRLNFLDFDINPPEETHFLDHDHRRDCGLDRCLRDKPSPGSEICVLQEYHSCQSLMPYLVMDILTDYPGLPGLFFAAVCSGSLSTVSSSINALAAVTLEDLIKPYSNMSEKHLYWMSKGLTFLYGFVCISMAGLASVLGSLMQAGVVITGFTGGPLLGLFSLGLFCPFANSKGGLAGLLSGMITSLCVTVGSQIYPSPPSMTRPLPLTTEGCNFTTTDILNWTSTALPTQLTTITTASANISGDNAALSAPEWHSPSYLYFGPIGTVTAITVGLIVSLCTGGWRTKVDSKFTLMKEDTTLYHLFMNIQTRGMRRSGRLDLTKDGEKKVGNTNPTFFDTEMDIIRSISA